ncbi:MAG: EthD family reductase [Candidatus Nanopelagicales bacterium]|nr:EthD family reductase [Candidatus Nanopelagicales bacterium]
MFKAMIMLTRRDDLTREQFAQWWLQEHAPMARDLPSIRRIVFNVVEQNLDAPCDGVTELWFNSRVDFDAAYATEIGEKVVADSLAHMSSRVQLFVDEQSVA